MWVEVSGPHILYRSVCVWVCVYVCVQFLKLKKAFKSNVWYFAPSPIPYLYKSTKIEQTKCKYIFIYLGVLEHMAFADLMYALFSSPSGKIRLRRDVPALIVTQDEHTVAATIRNWSAEDRMNHMPNLRFHLNKFNLPCVGSISGSIRKCQTWLHRTVEGSSDDI